MTLTGTVLVMAKAPRPGQVKTRLHPLLGPHGCAQLQSVLLRHTVATAVAAGQRVVVAFDPPDAFGEVEELLHGQRGVELIGQQPGHLGARMTAAADQGLPDGGPLVVIGTDAPTLGSELLAQAFDHLGKGAGSVLGPAADGGYYLLGVHWPHPAVFGIDPALWSGPQVAAATRARLPGPVLDLPVMRDLDTPQDAAALLDDPALPADIAETLCSDRVRWP